jgi:hypothetical protein
MNEDNSFKSQLSEALIRMPPGQLRLWEKSERTGPVGSEADKHG